MATPIAINARLFEARENASAVMFNIGLSPKNVSKVETIASKNANADIPINAIARFRIVNLLSETPDSLLLCCCQSCAQRKCLIESPHLDKGRLK